MHPHDDASSDTSERSAASEAARYLRQHRLVLVTAESCTAGLIASRLASVPGAGEVLDSAFVVYDPGAKVRHLGVRPETIARHNLTSKPVALEMAQGALAHSTAGVAVSNTGVVDDTDPEVEAGTQCFAWVFRTGTGARSFTETLVFQGGRDAIRAQAADHALARIAHYHRLLNPSTAPEVRADAAAH